MKPNKVVQVTCGIILGTLAGLYLGQCIRSANAHHIWPPILPSPQGGTVANNLTPVMQQAIERGYVTYSFEASASAYPNFRTQAADVAIASAFVIGLEAREVASGGDIWLTMPSDSQFIDICKAGAAACIQYWDEIVIIYFRRALLYSDWRSTIGHEGLNDGHAMGQHERYNDTNFTCITNPNPPTVMSCGSGIKYPTIWDRDVIWQILVPDLPSDAFTFESNGWLWVTYNGLRADAGAAHWNEKRLNNVTRVAIFYRDISFGWAWTGYYGPAVSGNSYANRGFDVTDWCIPGREFGVRPENEALWQIPLVSGFVKLAGTCQ
ncbi:hypothetical protein [Nocardioides sp.]|uniref:hypothetical protein n=1 Tax=Nocardioides sp. TaxID=35761 RepID=UPI002735609B|nr:hypothetical protein [Nocardioides sp.]MDP3893902.1 hypothetical protein [Nocardioides sp.]